MSLGNASLVIANIQANQIAAFIRVTISQNISFSTVQLIYMSYLMNWNYDMMEFTQEKTRWNLTHAWDHWKEKWVKNDALDCNKNTWQSSDFKSIPLKVRFSKIVVEVTQLFDIQKRLNQDYINYGWAYLSKSLESKWLEVDGLVGQGLLYTWTEDFGLFLFQNQNQ